jgi:hypothetical protein
LQPPQVGLKKSSSTSFPEADALALASSSDVSQWIELVFVVAMQP